MASFPRRGKVWLAQFSDDPKIRPALIASRNARNEKSTSVLAVPITTNLRQLSTHVYLPTRHAGLTQASIARCENVGYLANARLVRGPLGAMISSAIMREVDDALRASLML